MYDHAQLNWIGGSRTKENHNMRKGIQKNQLKFQKLCTYLISNCNIPSPFVHPSWHVFCLHKCYILKTRDVHKVNNWHTGDFFHLDKPGHRIWIVAKYVHIHKLKKKMKLFTYDISWQTLNFCVPRKMLFVAILEITTG